MQSSIEPDHQDRVDEVRERAALVRRETIRLVEIAKSGHYSSVFSCAEILGALYSGVMRIAEDPEWPERDRLILSKGHVAIGLYPLLVERGYFPADWLDDYTRLGSPLGDHPDMRRIPGVDFSSGSLGHGLSVGTGMAKAARLRGYDETRIWVLLGDQELNEGQVWEAAGSASHFGLGNLVAIVDANQMGLDGMTEETMSVEPIGGRFEAFGWDVVEIDGHEPEAILAAAAELPPATSDKPLCIVARTVKGKGVSYMELSRTWHIGYLSPDDSAAAVKEIDQRG
ncbi:MAG: Transketolase [Solirubrobacterales bacterium]|nr:Transketolase [Solirubrobacterales bacterium]